MNIIFKRYGSLFWDIRLLKKLPTQFLLDKANNNPFAIIKMYTAPTIWGRQGEPCALITTSRTEIKCLPSPFPQYATGLLWERLRGDQNNIIDTNAQIWHSTKICAIYLTIYIFSILGNQSRKSSSYKYTHCRDNIFSIFVFG